MKRLLFSVMFLLSYFVITAQNIYVHGKVTDDATNEGIIGATVFIKGTQDGTTTDLDGNYWLNCPSNGFLVFEHLDYWPEEVEVAGRSVINVALRSYSNHLDCIPTIDFSSAYIEKWHQH